MSGLRETLEAATPDWSKCNCGAGPYGIHAKWCALALARLDQIGAADETRLGKEQT
jgi:hypothetical protein